jgi:polyamine oxidase
MRIISVIAVFTLATGVGGDVAPSSSGVVEATSLQTRSLRGGAHAHEDDFSRQLLIHRRPRRPVDVGSNENSDPDGNSAGAPVNGNQAPVRREKRNPTAARIEKASLLLIGSSALLLTQVHSVQANQNCTVGPWGPFSPCDASTGLKKRMRAIIDAPLGEGAACPELMESYICSEVDAELTTEAEPTPEQLRAEASALAKAKKIIILGAGISGVTAAKTLAMNGFTSFVIVDANDYVGGRMQTKYDWAGRTIEAGANWIQGIEGPNPFLPLAKKYELTKVESNWENYTIVPEGIPYVEETEKRFAIAWNAMIARSVRYKKEKKTDLSIKHAMEYEGFFGDTPLERAIEYYTFDLQNGPAAITSLKSTYVGDVSTSTSYGDGQYFIEDKRGFSEVPRRLLREALGKENDPRLRLNTVVTQVAYNNTGVTVTTSSGEKITGDYAISTFSLGVIQHKHKSLFIPNLPESKLDAIFRKGMVTYTKIFLEFPTKFWTKYTKGTEYFLYPGEEEGRYQWWQDLTLPIYGDSFTKAKPNSHILLVTTSGKESERIETMDDQDVLDEIMEILGKMFPEEDSIPRAINIFIPRWRYNELYYGSYSYQEPGFRIEEDYAALQQPLDRLYFGGEYTSKSNSGFVTGGYLAGISAAKQIMVNAGVPADLIKTPIEELH